MADDNPTPPARVRSNRKVTLEAMHALAAARGGRCLASIYVNTDAPLRWQCQELHEWLASPASVKRGSWCRLCALQRSRRTLEEMQALARQHGGTLMSMTYVNGSTKMRWACAQGHSWLATGIGVQSGNWCRQCYYNSNRASLEQMRELARTKGGECLSTHYGTAHDHLEWRCAEGHTWSASLTTVKVSWCPHCGFERKRLGIAKMQDLAAMRGGKCLSTVYKNVVTPLTWQCDLGHVWQAKAMHIQRGHWCHECHAIRRARASEEARHKKRTRYATPVLI